MAALEAPSILPHNASSTPRSPVVDARHSPRAAVSLLSARTTAAAASKQPPVAAVVAPAAARKKGLLRLEILDFEVDCFGVADENR